MKRFIVIFIIMLFAAGLANAFPPFKIDDGKWLKIFYNGQFGYTYRDMGSGPDQSEDTNELNFRRNRLGFIGTYNSNLSFYFQTEYIEDPITEPLGVDYSNEGREFYVLDAQIRYKFNDALKLRVGKMKHNLTRENLEGCFEPLTLDRSHFVYTPFKTSRDKGVAVWGNLLNKKVGYKFDVMEGKKAEGTPSPSSNLRMTGRLHLSLLDPESGYGYNGTYLGKKTVLTIGAGYQYEPEAVYADLQRDANGNIISASDIKDYTAYSVDLFYEQPTSAGTFTFSTAYLDVSFDDAYKGTNTDPGITGLNGEKNGYYLKGAYMLPMDVGPGKLQFFARHDAFTFAKLGDVYDQDIGWTAGGFNYYIHGQDLKISGQYSQMDYDKESETDPNYQDFDTFKLFIQVRI
ncbi:selenite/tellurite reduction operon porin ExtI [Flexistipes sp.]|uniref:selenite/tellurite reduction operon porin ExtI n=1 Tax=Flexistipes sp. TaxID=3088135 RepID=UPI002E1B60CF|nr:selenite/tellurite reduction operon porin ExtI [Flexistipes sp.]